MANPTFLDTIGMELQMMEQKTLVEPVVELGEGEEVVGEADEALRKLYGIAMAWQRESEQALLNARYASDKENRKKILGKALELQDQSEVVLKLFWVSLKDAFNLWDKPQVGIRKDWKVVWCEPKDPPTILLPGFGFLGPQL